MFADKIANVMPIWERCLTNQVEHFEFIFFSSNHILQAHHFKRSIISYLSSFQNGLQSHLGTHTSTRLDLQSYLSNVISYLPYHNFEFHCSPSSYLPFST